MNRHHRQWMRAGALWAALVVGTSAAACGGDAAPAAHAAGTPAQLEPRSVKLTRSTEIDMADTIGVNGTLAAQDQVTVSVKAPGRLQSIAIDLGTVVKRGQVIAQIETPDYQLRVEQAQSALAQARALLGLPPDGADAQVDVESTTPVRQARATLDEAKGNVERARTLLERKLIAQAEFDTANAAYLRAESALQSAREEIYQRKAQLAQRKAELALARQQLADTTLRAPLDGVVQVRQASTGEFLSAGAPVATIVQIDPLRLRAEVPEREAASVRLGQIVRVVADESGGSYEGKIARLSPIINEQNRTLVVEAEVPNRGGELRPGSFVRAEISMEAPRKVLAVPTRAIVVFAGIEKVLTVEHGKALEKAIQTGRRSGEWTEVTGGLESGEQVVVDPGNLQQGQPVKAL